MTDLPEQEKLDQLLDREPENAAAHAGLRYVNLEEPGIIRKPWGRGFTYISPQGEHIPEGELRDRCEELVIPPAWTDVWICLDENGHIQATGRDAAGRKQYIYHPRWEDTRNQRKFNRLIVFAQRLPKLRAQVEADLHLEGLPRARVVALLVRLLDVTHIRIGNLEYASKNQTFGLSTLQDRHLRVEGSVLHFEFVGKSGKDQDADVRDERLAELARRCQDLPGQDLFQYVDDEGQRRTVTSTDVNEYLRECMGEAFSAKDFRTWGGTVVAANTLARMAREGEIEDPKKQAVEAVKLVAEALGNTPAVTRNYYIHPAIFTVHEEGRLALALYDISNGHLSDWEGLSARERGVLALLVDELAREVS